MWLFLFHQIVLTYSYQIGVFFLIIKHVESLLIEREGVHFISNRSDELELDFLFEIF